MVGELTAGLSKLAKDIGSARKECERAISTSTKERMARYITDRELALEKEARVNAHKVVEDVLA